jgi:hypothetical protein
MVRGSQTTICEILVLCDDRGLLLDRLVPDIGICCVSQSDLADSNSIAVAIT